MAKSVNTMLRSGAKTGENAYKGDNTGETKPGAAHMRCADPTGVITQGRRGIRVPVPAPAFQEKMAGVREIPESAIYSTLGVDNHGK
ncbi:hypothetical protein [Novosphingobium sp.]|uniref:hypothetical protein n=1 Tax=Novosphingobium sp. TaxID=1874826 RepID=UPI003D0E79AD